jgi:transcriptional regulator with XRE-family HTH domain
MSRKPRLATGIAAYGEGALLRQLRKDRGISSLTEMSEKLHYHKSFLSAIETGTEKASRGVIDGYEKVLELKPGELRDRIAALRANSPERTIEVLTNNWQLWLDLLPLILPNRGKDGAESEGRIDEHGQNAEQYQRSLVLVLKNAAESFLAQSQSLEEMKRCLKVLAVLSDPGERGKALRSEGLSDYFTSLASFTGQELTHAHQQLPAPVGVNSQTHPFPPLEGEDKRNLRDFIVALLSELSLDPLFKLQMSKELQEHLASNPRRPPTEIVKTLRQLYEMLELRYTPEQLERQMQAYITHMERAFRDVDLRSFAPKDQPATPALSDIFVVPFITKLDMNSPTPQQAGTESLIPILPFLSDSHYAVLLGGPGMGKSTITRYLTWSHTVIKEVGEPLPPSSLLPGNPLPLHIELRLFIEHWRLQNNALQQLRADDFLTYAAMVCSSAHDDTKISVPMFRHLLERRCMVVLFDGLDEVTGLRERQALVTVIEDFAHRYPGNYILVTSRPVGYALARFSDQVFKHIEIQAFHDEQIKKLVEQFYRYLVQEPTLSEQDEADIGTLLKRLREPGLHRLAVNPLLLTVMSIQSHTYGIADRRGEIYEACAQLLLSKWASLKGTDARWKDVQLDQEEQYACIAHLGFVLHEHMQEQTGTHADSSKQSAADVPRIFLQNEVERFLSNQDNLAGGTVEDLRTQAALFLDMMEVETGLIVQRGTGEEGLPLYGFIHRTFQEYFAAVAVYHQYLQELEEKPRQLYDFIMQRLHSAHWREVILLLLAKLLRRPATARLQAILDSNSSFNNILKQNLFFVCDCLLDEIMAGETLAKRVIAELLDVIRSSPFHSQQREAIAYLVSLLQTRQYARLAGGALRACMNEDSPLWARVDVAENLYRHTPQDSPEHQQAFQTLALAAQQHDLSPYDTADITMFLYQYSSEDSAHRQRAIDLFLSFTQRPQLTLEQLWGFANFLILRLRTDTSVRWQQDAQRILLQLVNRSDLTTQQRVELIQRLCNSSFNVPTLWSLTYQMLADLERSAQVTIGDVAQVTQMLYQCTQNFSSPEQPEVHLLARQKLQELLASPDLPIEEKLHIAETFLQSDEAELRYTAIQLCVRFIRGRELPPPATQHLLSLITRLYRYNKRAQERRQAFQMLAKLIHWRNINPGEILNFAWTLYRFGENDDDQRTHAVQLLSDIAKRKQAPVEQLLHIADAIHAANFSRPEPVHSVLQVLINLLEQNETLSTPQLLHVTTLLVSGVDTDNGWQHFTRALSLLLQRTDMTAEYLAQLTLDHRSDVSELRPRILQHLADLTTDQTLTITQRLLIVTPLLKSFDVSYVYKAKAVQAVITLLQPEPAEQFLRQYWSSPLSETIADMPFMAELAQQVLLPYPYRDGIYVKLRQMIAQTGGVVTAGHVQTTTVREII